MHPRSIAPRALSDIHVCFPYRPYSGVEEEISIMPKAASKEEPAVAAAGLRLHARTQGVFAAAQRWRRSRESRECYCYTVKCGERRLGLEAAGVIGGGSETWGWLYRLSRGTDAVGRCMRVCNVTQAEEGLETCSRHTCSCA